MALVDQRFKGASAILRSHRRRFIPDHGYLSVVVVGKLALWNGSIVALVVTWSELERIERLPSHP